MNNRQYTTGVTILELSIVLVIISLIVSVTIVGQHLVRATEIKSMLSKVSDMKNALGQFKTVYNKLPGDMDNASSFWPNAINGNGNGKIDEKDSNEAFEALVHLKLAGIINGNFSGSRNNGFVLDENVMKLNAKNSALYVRCCSKTDYDRNLDFLNHIVVFGISSGDINYRAGALTPIEALDIDQKTDDGNPDTGFIGASGSYSSSGYGALGCYAGTGSNALYESKNKDYKDLTTCQMFFAYDW